MESALFSVSTSFSSPLDETMAWLPASLAILCSSSLNLNDFGEPDRGVLGIADSGRGLILRGVNGLLRFIELEAEFLRALGARSGDSAERCDIGDPDACVI